MITVSLLQLCQNYHQDLDTSVNCQINLELYASYIYLSYYFNHDDLTLKNFARYFLHQFQDREHAEKPMKLQNQQSSQIFLQDSRNHTVSVHYTWKKHESVITRTAKTGH